MTPIDIIVDPISDGDKPVQVLHFSGQLDETNVDDEAKSIYGLIDKNPEGTCYIFDFENLAYLNSKSIGYVTDWCAKVNDKGGKLIIAQIPENISEILDAVGLAKIVTVCDSIADAKAEASK